MIHFMQDGQHRFALGDTVKEFVSVKVHLLLLTNERATI